MSAKDGLKLVTHTVWDLHAPRRWPVCSSRWRRFGSQRRGETMECASQSVTEELPFARRGRNRHREDGSGLPKGGGIDAPMTTTRFAARLKRWRAERQMGQAALAKASGVSREYIARLELSQ